MQKHDINPYLTSCLHFYLLPFFMTYKHVTHVLTTSNIIPGEKGVKF